MARGCLGYACPMPSKAETRRLAALALKVCEAVVELTRHRRQRGRGEQWVMLATVQDWLGVPDDDLQAAVAFAVSQGALMAEGDPVHSVAVHRRLGPPSL